MNSSGVQTGTSVLVMELHLKILASLKNPLRLHLKGGSGALSQTIILSNRGTSPKFSFQIIAEDGTIGPLINVVIFIAYCTEIKWAITITTPDDEAGPGLVSNPLTQLGVGQRSQIELSEIRIH
jgi:hypothetical protein